jgi:hypothetical protein
VTQKVRVGGIYIFQPVFFDTQNPPFGDVTAGDEVKVINLPGCPKANAMGMCYIAKAGQFVGMVMTNSLVKK